MKRLELAVREKEKHWSFDDREHNRQRAINKHNAEMVRLTALIDDLLI